MKTDKTLWWIAHGCATIALGISIGCIIRTYIEGEFIWTAIFGIFLFISLILLMVAIKIKKLIYLEEGEQKS